MQMEKNGLSIDEREWHATYYLFPDMLTTFSEKQAQFLVQNMRDIQKETRKKKNGKEEEKRDKREE